MYQKSRPYTTGRETEVYGYEGVVMAGETFDLVVVLVLVLVTAVISSRLIPIPSPGKKH